MSENIFFSRVLESPTRCTRVAEFVVDRLVNAESWNDFKRWVWFFERTMDTTGDVYSSQPRRLEFVRRVADLAHAAGVFTPGVLFAVWQADSGPARERAYVNTLDLIGEHAYDEDYLRQIVDDSGYVSTCPDCESRYRSSDGRHTTTNDYVCSTCAEDHYRWSSWHDALVARSRATSALDPDGCRVVIDEDADGFEWDDDLESLVHEDYDRGPPPLIRQYHDSKDHIRPQEDDWSLEHGGRLFGVELEVECARDPETVAAAIHQHVNGGEFGRSMFFERDGSLSNGFEMITQPMSLPAVRQLFGFLRESALTRGVTSHRTSTCGLHVHVSRTGLDNLTIARAVTFVNDPSNDAFVQALARRYNTGYCRVVEKEIDTAHLPGERYEAVNLTGLATIEFRIFRGSLKYEAVIAAVEFCHALLEYCARPSTASSKLNARAFLEFCRDQLPAETATLRPYVEARTAGLFRFSEAA